MSRGGGFDLSYFFAAGTSGHLTAPISLRAAVGAAKNLMLGYTLPNETASKQASGIVKSMMLALTDFRLPMLEALEALSNVK